MKSEISDPFPIENHKSKIENSMVPFNEINRVLDLGFKPIPGGNTGYIKSNLTPLQS